MFDTIWYPKYDLTLFPLGYFEDLSPLGGGLIWPPPQISATNGPIDSKIGTVVKQVKKNKKRKEKKIWTVTFF